MSVSHNQYSNCYCSPLKWIDSNLSSTELKLERFQNYLHNSVNRQYVYYGRALFAQFTSIFDQAVIVRGSIFLLFFIRRLLPQNFLCKLLPQNVSMKSNVTNAKFIFAIHRDAKKGCANRETVNETYFWSKSFHVGFFCHFHETVCLSTAD